MHTLVNLPFPSFFELGYVVSIIIENPETFDQRTVYMASELITVPTMATVYSQGIHHHLLVDILTSSLSP